VFRDRVHGWRGRECISTAVRAARRIVAGGNASNIGDKQPDVQPMDSRASCAKTALRPIDIQRPLRRAGRKTRRTGRKCCKPMRRMPHSFLDISGLSIWDRW
jgi:hypothetical protein